MAAHETFEPGGHPSQVIESHRPGALRWIARIFFFAFLPQFVPADAGAPVPRMLALSGVFMAMTFVVFGLYGVFAASVRTRLLDRPRIVDRLRRAFAVSFVALGAKLALTER